MTRRAGIGLRQPHYAEVLEGRPPLGFVEVHSENFFADGGAALAVLHEARASYDVSLHGVGLALGSAAGVEPWHLERLARLVDRIDPVRVSDHASFARVPRTAGLPALHANDLLPIAFSAASLDILCANVAQVQDRLKRPILVEHVSAYLTFDDDRIPEPAFFAALAQRPGCAMPRPSASAGSCSACSRPTPTPKASPPASTTRARCAACRRTARTQMHRRHVRSPAPTPRSRS